ncbi:HlyD family secretion protein [Rhodopila sp.]|jgi:membrane fusion protein (multidrug efflux system)|uniref:HlyD family secretion protein n=1 Tax=Rhodopila sp. TaxID=2480087 RepID=UPI002C4F9901|nr:HlyD family secretion protein [Rhodopila sp.]HVZ07271.1 HlyD family secretion protein [Rhodopila sp.]
MTAISDIKPAQPQVSEAPATPPPARRRKTIRLALLLAAGIGLVVGGSWYWTVGRFLESTDNAYVQGDIAVLSAQVDGHVAAIKVTDNQLVRAGDTLIELEGTTWRAALAQAEASLAEATAAQGTLHEQIGAQDAQIELARAHIAQAQAEQDRATSDAQRYSTLSGQGFASRQTYERAVADQRKAAASLAAAVAEEQAARRQRAVLQAQLLQAAARQSEASAAVDRARADLDHTVIRAPFDGIVGNRAAQLGQYVRPGQQLIAVAPPPNRLWVVANFKETQLHRVRDGQPVSITVDALPGLALNGKVESLAPATGSLFSLLPPENATGNFTKIVQRVPVRVALDGDAATLALLRPGLSVEAEIDTRTDPTRPRGFLLGALDGLASTFTASAHTVGLRPASLHNLSAPAE